MKKEAKELKEKLAMVVTDIELTDNGWSLCLCGSGPQHCLTKFTAMLLSLEIWNFIRHREDTEFLKMYDDYRKHVVLHHDHDHSFRNERAEANENSLALFHVPSGI